eukprot:4229665-Amphidinium_carterae.1
MSVPHCNRRAVDGRIAMAVQMAASVPWSDMIHQILFSARLQRIDCCGGTCGSLSHERSPKWHLLRSAPLPKPIAGQLCSWRQKKVMLDVDEGAPWLTWICRQCASSENLCMGGILCFRLNAICGCLEVSGLSSRPAAEWPDS